MLLDTLGASFQKGILQQVTELQEQNMVLKIFNLTKKNEQLEQVLDPNWTFNTNWSLYQR